jgi:hypothetical protein
MIYMVLASLGMLAVGWLVWRLVQRQEKKGTKGLRD